MRSTVRTTAARISLSGVIMPAWAATYGTFDAQRIFDELEDGDLHIEPLKFEHAAWSKKAGCMVSNKTFPKNRRRPDFLVRHEGP